MPIAYPASMDGGSPIDPQLVAWTPGPSLEVAPEVLALRALVESIARHLLGVRDDRLEARWPWPGGDEHVDVDVRSGFYFLYERLEATRAEALRVSVTANIRRPAGARMGAASTAARWSLHGLLLPLADADLDRDPGGGEWPIRETLGHVLSSQRGYGRFTAWWLTQAPTPGAIVPAELRNMMPERSEEAAGSASDIRTRLDALLDLSMARLGSLDDSELRMPARWSGGEVTVGFRIGRWASHLREHTIQIEKTLAMLGRQSTEVERLVRLLFDGFGRLEEVVFGLDPDQVGRQHDAEASIADAISGVTSELTRIAPGIVAAARP